MDAADRPLRHLMDLIVLGDGAAVTRALHDSPTLVRASIRGGATRAEPDEHFLTAIRHHVYAGDTALHIAAASHRVDLVRALLHAKANVSATNRRGAQALHYATDGGPGLPGWNPAGQAETVSWLIAAGADANVTDKGGVSPLHRAVRNRCARAVAALLDGGADPSLRNGNGSLPLQLATLTTGRGGSGTAEAKAEQAEIIRLLEARSTRLARG